MRFSVICYVLNSNLTIHIARYTIFFFPTENKQVAKLFPSTGNDLETSNLLYSTLFYIQRATKLSVKDKKNIQLVGGPLSIYLGQTHQNFSSCIRY